MSIQTPPEPALEPRSAPHLSFSQIDTYRRCSWRWYLKYVLKWEDRPSLNLVRGKAGHLALERDHRRKIKTGENISKEELLDTFSDAFDAHLTELTPADLGPDDNPDKNKDATAQTLSVYAGKAAKGINPVAVEMAFDHVIPASEQYEKDILVLVRLDLLDKTGIFDNKFPNSRRGVKSVEEADSSWQLSLYDDALLTNYGVEAPNLGFITFLPPSPNGREVAEIRTTRRSPDAQVDAQRAARRDRVRHVIQATQRGIDAQIFIPADDPKTCAYCPYRTRCQSSLVKDDFLAASIRNAP
jgi:hypothetical protein